jgi:hypothetical protein
VIALTAASGLIQIAPLDSARRAGLPVGLAGLVVLPIAWRAYVALRERAGETKDIETGCARYGAALLIALAMTEGVAFVGIVFYLLGADIVALTGVLSHILLTGVLWPTAEKVAPFLGRAL